MKAVRLKMSRIYLLNKNGFLLRYWLVSGAKPWLFFTQANIKMYWSFMLSKDSKDKEV